MKSPLTLHHQPSGLNSHFTCGHLSFSGYIHHMQEIIEKARLDLDNEKHDWIIANNIPYEWRPHPGPIKNGVLLIHGLSGAPFILRDVANYFRNQDFLVRGLLLPGHGTRPGDLTEVSAKDWLATIEYGIKSFAGEVENLYLVGLSLGSALSLIKALQGAPIKGLILFAPAIKIKSPLAPLCYTNYLISWCYERAKWLRVTNERAHTRYESLPFNAVIQTMKILRLLKHLIDHNTLSIPMMIALSEDDETVSALSVIDFFKQQLNPLSKMLLYTKHRRDLGDDRIQTALSVFPEQHILDFSHHCIPISPLNPYYGANSGYVDLLHYRSRLIRSHLKPDVATVPIYKGAIHAENLKAHHLQRLNYNPDFDNLIVEIDKFIRTVK